MSFNKSNWGWSRTGLPPAPELNALFWQVGDFGWICCSLSKCRRKFGFPYLWVTVWFVELLVERPASVFLLNFGQKRGSDYLSEEVHAFKSSVGENVSPSCTELCIQNLEKSKILQIPHLLQGVSMYSVLTFVDPMLRLQFNDNIFLMVMPIKKIFCFRLFPAGHSSLYSFILQFSSVMLMSITVWNSKWLKEWETLGWFLSVMKLPWRTGFIGTLFFLCHRESHEWCEKAGLASWSWAYICDVIPARRTRIMSNNSRPGRGNFYRCTHFYSNGMVWLSTFCSEYVKKPGSSSLVV